MRKGRSAFTLAELLVSITILALLVLLSSRMINSATNIVTLEYKRMDTDSQVRPVLERIGVDLAQMIKRPDVDYYVKSHLDPENGNDRMAFFSNSPGYYPSTGAQSPLSLVSYRICEESSSPAYHRMERMSKGLVWAGVSTTDTPMLFGPQAIVNNWPTATKAATPDPDYELFAPQIFRFEYFYLLKTGSLSALPGANGMQDVSAISVLLATMAPKSRVLLSDDQIGTLIARLKDFDDSAPGYDLAASWQSTLDGITDMPRQAIAGVRVYQHYYNLSP